MAASRKRQRALIDEIAESAVVDDDVQEASKAPAKKASKKAKKPARKGSKKTTKKGPKKGSKKGRRGNPLSANADGMDENVGEGEPTPKATKSSKRARPHLREAPDEIRCQAVVHVSGEEPRRCTRYTVKIDDDHRDVFCSGHSNTERATQIRQRLVEGGQRANEARAAAAELDPLFVTPIDTQDDVARERLNILRWLVAAKEKRLTQGQAVAALQGLKDVSLHIERYGSHQGVEGGHSILRILPGVRIVEANFDFDRVFTKDELEAIMDGMEQDAKDGIPPAVTVEEQAKRYLGRVVRPVEHSRYHDREDLHD